MSSVFPCIGSVLCGVTSTALAFLIASGPGRDLQAVVRAVEARYRSATTLRATFLERYSESRRDVRIESGTVYFSRPGRMRWEYESPEAKLFLVDGKTAWFYVPADRTVTRAPVKESADWRTPLALLAGKARLSRFCGRLEFLDGPVAVPGHVVLRCLPRGEASRAVPPKSENGAPAASGNGLIHEVLLEVDAGRSELVRVLIREAGGVEIEFRFGNWQHNLPLPEAIFHFQTPPGVAIVEEPSIGGPLR